MWYTNATTALILKHCDISKWGITDEQLTELVETHYHSFNFLLNVISLQFKIDILENQIKLNRHNLNTSKLTTEQKQQHMQNEIHLIEKKDFITCELNKLQKNSSLAQDFLDIEILLHTLDGLNKRFAVISEAQATTSVLALSKNHVFTILLVSMIVASRFNSDGQEITINDFIRNSDGFINDTFCTFDTFNRLKLLLKKLENTIPQLRELIHQIIYENFRSHFTTTLNKLELAQSELTQSNIDAAIDCIETVENEIYHLTSTYMRDRNKYENYHIDVLNSHDEIFERIEDIIEEIKCVINNHAVVILEHLHLTAIKYHIHLLTEDEDETPNKTNNIKHLLSYLKIEDIDELKDRLNSPFNDKTNTKLLLSLLSEIENNSPLNCSSLDQSLPSVSSPDIDPRFSPSSTPNHSGATSPFDPEESKTINEIVNDKAQQTIQNLNNDDAKHFFKAVLEPFICTRKGKTFWEIENHSASIHFEQLHSAISLAMKSKLGDKLDHLKQLHQLARNAIVANKYPFFKPQKPNYLAEFYVDIINMLSGTQSLQDFRFKWEGIQEKTTTLNFGI